MNTTIEATGTCLCGAVTIEAKSLSTSVGACHCDSCRKWTGGPLMTVDCSDDIKFSGGEFISTYASSEWAERGFCSKCGSHLFYRLTQNNQYIVPVGLFGLDKELNFDHQIFVEEQPEFYSFSNETHNMTGAEVFAQFSSD